MAYYSRKSGGLLHKVGKVIALIIPILCAYGMIRQICDSEKAVSELLVPLSYGAFFLITTAFLAVCICMTTRYVCLRAAKLLALFCLLGMMAYGLACFVMEVLLGAYIPSWLGGTLFWSPVYASYWWLLARKQKRINQAEETMTSREKSNKGSNNYYVHMSDVLDHSTESGENTRDVSP